MSSKRAIVIVLDSVGIGEAPDAAAAAVLAARDAEPHADADAAQLIRLLREKIAAYEVDQ